VKPYIIEPTPCSRVLLETLPVAQLLSNFPAVYGTHKFITVFTGACHWSLTLTLANTILFYFSKIHFNIPMRSLDFFNLPNPSSRTVALGSSTRNLPAGRRVRLTSAPYVNRLSRKMWEPRRPTTLWACRALYRDSFTCYSPTSRSSW
jgi:hypothetical protein